MMINAQSGNGHASETNEEMDTLVRTATLWSLTYIIDLTWPYTTGRESNPNNFDDLEF